MESTNIASLKEQLSLWQKNLATLQLEEAKAGGHPPVSTVNDIMEAKQRILALEAAIDQAAAGKESPTLVSDYNAVFRLFQRLDKRVDELHNRVDAIDRIVNPPVQVIVARIIATVLFVATLSFWLIFETRSFLLAYPFYGAGLSLTLPAMGVLVLWLSKSK